MEMVANELDAAALLTGARVLLVEDEFILLMELEMIMQDAGAKIAASCRDPKEALVALDSAEITAAVLDVRLGSETAAPVARELAQRGIPFLFYTGQDGADPVLSEWPNCLVLTKPATAQSLVEAVNGLMRS
jgi:DNA-binding response OmpR family regulator